MNVVFISCSPLAGAPIRIVNALNKYADIHARLIDLNPNCYGARVFPEDLIWEKDKEECLELISKADILHFHHFFDVESDNNPFKINFKKLAPNTKIIRHFHTDLEQIAIWMDIPVSVFLNDPYPKLVIPHYPERTLLDAFVVPNIIPINDEILTPKETQNKIQKVFFSASSNGSMWDVRWNTKGLPEVADKFKHLQHIENFCFELVQNTPYMECQKLKQDCDIIIGDTTSGSYHLTDLEALSQGKPTFSYLDNRSQMVLQNLLQCEDLPFINSRLEEIDLPFLEVLRNKELQKEIGAFSRTWIEKYYNEEKLIKFFIEAYEKALNNEPLKRQACLEFKNAKKFLYNNLYNLQWEARKKRNYIPPKENEKNIKDILQNIFSVKNEYRNGFKRKVIKILGLKISFKKCCLLSPDKLKIKIYIGGGLGDFLIAANYIYHFSKFIEKNENIIIDVYTRKSQYGLLRASMDEQTFIDNCFVSEEHKNEYYDVNACMDTQIHFCCDDMDKVQKISPKLHSLLEKYFEFENQNKFFATYHTNYYHIALAQGKSRLQMADIDGSLKIEKNFDYPLPYPKNEGKILEKFNLKNKIFITLNRGIDKNSANPESTKMWPLEHFNKLTKLLKNAHPDITLVQLGSSKNRCKSLDCIDINLVGQTNLDDVKVLIKNSFLHFDCEGGFAHLRNALQAKHPAVVIFGPTNPDLYGYETNINIYNKNACPIRCDWIIEGWQKHCLNNTNAQCIKTIAPEYVYARVNEYIQKNMENKNE